MDAIDSSGLSGLAVCVCLPQGRELLVPAALILAQLARQLVSAFSAVALPAERLVQLQLAPAVAADPWALLLLARKVDWAVILRQLPGASPDKGCTPEALACADYRLETLPAGRGA